MEMEKTGTNKAGTICSGYRCIFAPIELKAWSETTTDAGLHQTRENEPKSQAAYLYLLIICDL